MTATFANTSRGVPVHDAVLPRRPAGRSPVEWLLEGVTGRAVRTVVIDSGVDYNHEAIGRTGSSYAVAGDVGGVGRRVVPTEVRDDVGHGTACAGIIANVAPQAEIDSLRILGAGNTGAGRDLELALAWAIRERYHLVNLSLSVRGLSYRPALLALSEEAERSRVVIVASANNHAILSYPWALPTVISVGAHDRPQPYLIEVNPEPPVDFFAGGVRVRAAWRDGQWKLLSGNSFATPAVTGLLALVMERYPRLPLWQYKHLLSTLACNWNETPEEARE